MKSRTLAPGIHRFPVEVTVSTLHSQTRVVVPVISRTPTDAADLVQREFAGILDQPHEITVYGPRGGVACHRFTGYERLIGLKIFHHLPSCKTQQLTLI